MVDSHIIASACVLKLRFYFSALCARDTAPSFVENCRSSMLYVSCNLWLSDRYRSRLLIQLSMAGPVFWLVHRSWLSSGWLVGIVIIPQEEAQLPARSISHWFLKFESLPEPYLLEQWYTLCYSALILLTQKLQYRNFDKVSSLFDQ
jgi:hypothetical protein